MGGRGRVSGPGRWLYPGEACKARSRQIRISQSPRRDREPLQAKPPNAQATEKNL
jgi:hypothetical protein